MCRLFMGIIGDNTFKKYHYGCLISDQWFLTSAYCAINESCTKKVRFGVHDSTSGAGQGWPEYDVIEKHIHPHHDPATVYNNVGLYKLNRPVTFSKYVRPICLLNQHHYPGVQGIVIGELDNTFKKGIATMLPRKSCNISNTSIKDENMFCIDMYRGPNTIQMYSGVPMVLKMDDAYCMYGLLGLATFGSMDEPEGYQRISYYIPWIESIVWP